VAEANGTTLYLPNGSALVPLAEVQERQYVDTIELLQERLAELELAIEDTGWERLTGVDGDRELSRDALRKIARQARLAFLKNPLVNRAVTLQAYYVWGQGVSIEGRHPDVDAVVQSFLDDPKNQAELTSHQARTLKEMDLQVEGNLFFCFFVAPATGRVRVRTMPADQVAEIVTNPEDAKDVWYYKRVWTPRPVDGSVGVQQTVYYPDWRHTPRERPSSVGGRSIDWATPVYHVKVGGLSDMRFGVPEVYAALDWSRAYKSFLEDWSTIVRALSRFAWNLSTKGGPKGVAAAKAKLGTTFASGGATGETNPPPVAGSTFIGAEGYKLDPIRTSGATTSAEDGRRLLLMVAAATGLPESFFGDVSVGTLATAKSLDRPTELKFRDRQTLWGDALHDILQYVVEQAVRAPQGPLQGQITTDADGLTVITLPDDPETGEPIDRGIDVTFPPILEHDVEAGVNAVVKAATLGGQGQLAGTLPVKFVARLLLQALGEDDIDELLDEFFPEDGPAPDAGAPPEGETEPPAQETPEQAFAAAVRDLRTELARLKEG